MRITGMSSGMDIDSIVKDLMKAHRVPIDRLGQKKQVLEWQREEYRQMNSKLVDFRNNKLFNYSLNSSIDTKKATVTGETAALTAASTKSAVEGSLTIRVNELAKSGSVVSNGAGIDPTASTTATLQNLIDNGKMADFSGSITVNGAPITIDKATDTINSLLSKINTNAAAKASAFYDTATGKLSITSKETGKINGTGEVTLSGALLTSSFNMTNVTLGDDAQLEINGIATTRSSNIFSINGVEVTLKAKTVADPTEIKVSKDVDAIVNTIKSFINDYNDLLSTMSDKVKEERNRNVLPLTKEQRDDMKEDEVTRWESKAKSGLLRNEALLTKTINDVRASTNKPVTIGAETVTLGMLGIETGKYFENGKLYLKDENKLREMLEDNPTKVMSFFTQQSGSVSSKGLFERMRDDIQISLNAISSKAGTSAFTSSLTQPFSSESMIGKDLKQLTDQMIQKDSKLSDLENNYYKKFNAMEQAMNKYQSQSAYLANALG
ncbi:hypothetical protein SY83_11015 [Paenibacillus swuensis]|uniref:Flagellar hook-associated protein 2 n=1 Tax=Paenibacillus swuensis TaxID=1178515 RepID=A0A172TII8_9BACL|nr:flagellar filament capping protein FliD [Paenibacillus swuensis]ANE46714.1 hypothetical protein SY83_11015 [Paenibacillus swuensis]